MHVTFFAAAAAFRSWLERHHERARECGVGIHRKGTGRGGITYSEALDEALCFGWIDGVRRRVDECGYSIRFSPRKARSIWSLVNVRRVQALQKAGRMAPAGMRAFEARSAARTGVYSFERTERTFDAAADKRFRASKRAHAFFMAQAAWYRRTATWWVMSGKRDETRARRLEILVSHSKRSEWLPMLAEKKPKGGSPAPREG